MKIAHIANFYTEQSGGIKTVVAQLGSRYQKLGHEFTLIVPGESFGVEKMPFGTKISLPSIPLPFTGGYRMIRSRKEVKNLLTVITPCRIEVSDRLNLSSIGRWAKSRGIHSIVFSHESLEALVTRFLRLRPLARLVRWHNIKLANSFNVVVATSNFAAQEFETAKVDNLRRISLGVDLENFHPSARDNSLRKELLAGEELLLVHCGRLSHEKNPGLSLEVLKALRESGVKARLIYLGMGPLYKTLRTRALGLPITFLGYVANRKKVASILASADVVLTPGPHETFCLAALESLACGSPVIASNRSAVGEFFAGVDGALTGQTCSENPTDWVMAIRALTADPNTRTNCRKRAEAYSWQKTISELLATAHDSNELVA